MTLVYAQTGEIYEGSIYGGPNIGNRVGLLEDNEAASLITGVVIGGDFRANAGDDSKLDLDAITIYDPNQPPAQRIFTIPEQLAVTPPAGVVIRITATKAAGYILESFTGHLTETEKIDGKVQTGIFTKLNGTNIDNEFVTVSAVYGSTKANNADIFGKGIVLLDGLDIILNSDLTFGAEAGSFFDPLAPSFHSTPKEPYNALQAAVTAFGVDANTTMFRQWYGNAGETNPKISGFISTVDPSVYDDPTIAPTDGAPSGSMSGQDSQNISIHLAKSKTGIRCGIDYDRINYSAPLTFDDAKAAATVQSFDHGVNVLGTRFSGNISVKFGTTDLSDTANAVWTHPQGSLVTTR